MDSRSPVYNGNPATIRERITPDLTALGRVLPPSAIVDTAVQHGMAANQQSQVPVRRGNITDLFQAGQTGQQAATSSNQFPSVSSALSPTSSADSLPSESDGGSASTLGTSTSTGSRSGSEDEKYFLSTSGYFDYVSERSVYCHVCSSHTKVLILSHIVFR